MKRIIGLLILVFLTSLTSETKEHKCTATHYDTKKFPIVHRKHSTAAISSDLIKLFKIKVGKKEKGIVKKQGGFLVITNLSNNKSDTVEVTDRCAAGPNHVDLSKTSFSKIEDLEKGRIIVIVKKVI